LFFKGYHISLSLQKILEIEAEKLEQEKASQPQKPTKSLPQTVAEPKFKVTKVEVVRLLNLMITYLLKAYDPKHRRSPQFLFDCPNGKLNPFCADLPREAKETFFKELKQELEKFRGVVNKTEFKKS